MYVALISLVFLFCHSCQCQSSHVTTSVIIPCFYGHFKHLDELMNALCNQTVLPDEVVISLSEIDKLNPALIKKFENKKYPFPVKLIKHRELLWAGPNRNSACEHAIGDIFICQDADDLPHPQRIEIIKYFFENFDVNHLIHCFSYEPITEKYNTTSLNYTRLKSRGIIEACL